MALEQRPKHTRHGGPPHRCILDVACPSCGTLFRCALQCGHSGDCDPGRDVLAPPAVPSTTILCGGA